MSKNVCDNCGWFGTDSDMDEIDNLDQRVDPGSVVPSGQCPKCGALCYPENSYGKVKDDAIDDAVTILGTYKVLVASLLDGNKNPNKDFLEALQKSNMNVQRKLKKARVNV